MAAPNEYQIVLKDINGIQLAILDNFTSFEISRVTNGIGAITLVMPDNEAVSTNSWDKFQIDGRLEVWRSVAGGPLSLHTDTVYFIRRKTRILSADGSRTFVISGEDANSLLNRRYILWTAGNAKSYFTTTAQDDALKDIFVNNLGASAGTGRDWSSYINVQADLTAAPTASKAFSWRNVLLVMQEIAANSATTGTYLAFDMVWTGSAFEYRTYTGQRGIDRRWTTGNTLLLSPDTGTIADASLTQDCGEEKTFVEAAGYGVEADRITGTASETTRTGISPFGRIEYFTQVASVDSTSVTDEADAQLRMMRARLIFTASLIQTDGCQYGLHYSWGDYVTAQFFGQTFDCRIDAVHISVSGGKESIEVLLRMEAGV